MTQYKKLVAEGIETANHCSDLHFPVTERTKEILREYPDAKPIMFLNQITKTTWFQVNFAYDPFWVRPDSSDRHNQYEETDV